MKFHPCTVLLKHNLRIRKLVQDYRMKRLDWFKGVNIILTYRCNLGCEYCYEKGVKLNYSDITLDDFEKTIKWLRENNKEKIILLGGEPTQHANFEEILAICSKYQMYIVLLTNMAFGDSIVKAISQYKRCVLQANVNGPATYPKEIYERVCSNVRRLYTNVVAVVLRYNIYKDNSDFTAIVKLAKDINSSIRFSLINSPLNCESGVKQNREHVENVYEKKSIVRFLDTCEKEKVSAFFARPVPKCLFSQEEIQKYKKNGIKYKCYVGRNDDYAARVNIQPDMSVMACYGVPIRGPKVTSFKSYQELSEYYKDSFIKLRKIPAMSKCQTCPEYLNNVCQGGCLSERKEWDL